MNELLPPPAGLPAVHAPLWQIAAEALTSNRVVIGDGRLLAAGRHQFGSMWTRDFAYAARGLIALGDHRTARDHLELLLDHATEEGIVPRALDTVPIALRVVTGMLRGLLGTGPRSINRRGAMKAQLIDEHGSPALDSGLLVVATALRYAAATGDEAWLRARRPTLRRLIEAYVRFRDGDGLITQPKFSDWQDSARREGKGLYLNVLFLDVARRFGEAAAPELDGLARRLFSTFHDPHTGLYRSLAGQDFFSIDGNLLALDLGVIDADRDEGRDLYTAMKRSALWSRGGLPGSVTIDDYPKSWIHLPARLAGLRHYHDRMHWSWLTALAAKVAHRMGDRAEASRIFDGLTKMARRDGTIAEIYHLEGEALVPFRSWLYRSEAPFSWGAGVVLDALCSVYGTR